MSTRRSAKISFFGCKSSDFQLSEDLDPEDLRPKAAKPTVLQPSAPKSSNEAPGGKPKAQIPNNWVVAMVAKLQ